MALPVGYDEGACSLLIETGGIETGDERTSSATKVRAVMPGAVVLSGVVLLVTLLSLLGLRVQLLPAEVLDAEDKQAVPAYNPWAAGTVGAYGCAQQKMSCKSHSGPTCYDYAGRLGNALMDLTGVLLQAQQMGLCIAWLPPADLTELQQILTIPSDGVILVTPGADRSWVSTTCDTQDSYGSSMNSKCEDSGFLFHNQDVTQGRQVLQKYVVDQGLMNCAGVDQTRPELGVSGVVMHMRSGDSLRALPGEAPQPPCAYYEEVMTKGNYGGPYEHALILTQPDMGNPCINYIKDKFPTKVTVQSSTVTQDACTMTLAQNLAIGGWSSWGIQLSRLNVNLLHFHVPFGLEGAVYSVAPGWAPDWVNHAVQPGMLYTQHTYSFPGFNTMAGNTAANLMAPCQIVKTTLPGTAETPTTTAATNSTTIPAAIPKTTAAFVNATSSSTPTTTTA